MTRLCTHRCTCGLPNWWGRTYEGEVGAVREGDVDEPVRDPRGSSKIMPRLTRDL